MQLEALRRNNHPWCAPAAPFAPLQREGGRPAPGCQVLATIAGGLTRVRRPNHGIQTAYEYGFDIGGLDPSLYFGFRKDLYHFDHFMGQ